MFAHLAHWNQRVSNRTHVRSLVEPVACLLSLIHAIEEQSPEGSDLGADRHGLQCAPQRRSASNINMQRRDRFHDRAMFESVRGTRAERNGEASE